MFIIAIIIVLGTMIVATGFGGLTAMLDVPSLVIPILMVAVIIGAAGLSKDFLRGLKSAVSKENIYTVKELKRTRLSLKLALWTLLLSGLGTTLIGWVALLSFISDPANLNSAFSVSMISFTYSIFMMILLLPVDFKIRCIILELEEKHEEN